MSIMASSVPRKIPTGTDLMGSTSALTRKAGNQHFEKHVGMIVRRDPSIRIGMKEESVEVFTRVVGNGHVDPGRRVFLGKQERLS